MAPTGVLHTVRFWYTATVIGKHILLLVLLAFVNGKINNTYSDELCIYYSDLRKRKKTNKEERGLFKSSFNAGERSKLEDPGCREDSLDITLMAKLLGQLGHLTGLADHSDADTWTKQPPPNTDPGIEYLIHRVKSFRNDACHEENSMSEIELSQKLDEMRDVYIKLITKVYTKQGIPSEDIRKATDDIKDRINTDKIREELTTQDIEKYRKEIQDHIEKEHLESNECCGRILKQGYKDTYEYHYPGAWLDISHKIKTVQGFTELVISEDNKKLGKYDTINDTKYDYRKILSLKTKQGEVPRIFTINSVGGNGKSTYTRLYVCSWDKPPNSIDGLDEINLLFFIEFRNLDSGETSFENLIKHRLGDALSELGFSVQTLKNNILKSKLLFIMDGFDESPQSENELLKDILSLAAKHNKIRVIVTSRPEANIELQECINVHQTPKLDLVLLGVSNNRQLEFIENYVNAIVEIEAGQIEIMDKVRKILPHLNENLDEIMTSPLILFLLTLLLIEGDIDDTITSTQVFIKTNDALRAKLESRLKHKMTGRTPMKNSLKTNLDLFEIFFNRTANETFHDKELIFTDKTMDKIKDKIRQCELGDYITDLLEHYLEPRRSRVNLVTVIKYSFKHLKMHEFSSSLHACHVLATGDDAAKEAILDQIKEPRFVNIRSNIIAILSYETSYHHILTTHVKRIIDIEKDVVQKAGRIDRYLALIKESKENVKVLEIVARNVKQLTEWNVKSPGGLKALADMMKDTQPKKLCLNFRYYHSQFPSYLATAIQKISEYELEIQLKFDTKPTAENDINTHDEYINVLKSNGRATLTAFSGRLGQAGLKQLPSSIHQLEVMTHSTGVPVLLERIPQLQQLQKLEIHLMCSELKILPNLVPVNYPSTLARRDIRIHIYEDKDSDIRRIGAFTLEEGAAGRTYSFYGSTSDVNDTTPHDECMAYTTRHGAALTFFGGALTGAGLRELNTTLELLGVRVQPTDLPVLLDRITQLQQLRSLDLHLKCSELGDLTDLAVMTPPRSLGIIIIKLHGDVSDGHIATIGVLAHRLLRTGMADEDGYKELWLLNSNISGLLAIELLKKLSEHQVKCTDIDISSSALPSDPEQLELRRLAAKTCADCGIIWWHGNTRIELKPLGPDDNIDATEASQLVDT